MPVSDIVNGMSVDVEEHFQVQAFSDCFERAGWSSQPGRAAANVGRILELFEQQSVKATFFVLAWVAERSPSMVRDIVSAGHELASHGCDHMPAFHQTQAEFADDIRRSKAILEDLGGVAVTGYRAPSFSITPRNAWAFEELANAGYRYSSSVFPVRHDFYGWPDAPRFTYAPGPEGLLECPVTTMELAGGRLPFGGGGYFRLLPYPVFRWGLNRVRSTDEQPCFFYFHPWEIDTEQPRVKGARLSSRFRHYVNLHRVESRLRQLTTDFRWGRYDQILGIGGANA